MAGTYSSVLPQVFKYSMEAPLSKVPLIVAILTSAGRRNSFAITADAKDGYVNVWMSEVSYQVISHNYAAIIHPHQAEPEFDDDFQPGDS